MADQKMLGGQVGLKSRSFAGGTVILNPWLVIMKFQSLARVKNVEKISLLQDRVFTDQLLTFPRSILALLLRYCPNGIEPHVLNPAIVFFPKVRHH